MSVPIERFWGEKKNRLLLLMAGVFLVAFFVPWSAPRVSAAVNEAFLMLGEYAREHILLCLVRAFFIAGAITVFLNQQAVITYLGPTAPKLVAYSVASVSGTILAVCSCTVLPLFKGIYKKGAGLGPAINVLAIILTAKVLGAQLGVARVVGLPLSMEVGNRRALRRCPRGRLPARTSRPHGAHPGELDREPGGNQFARQQSHGLGCRRAHVLRHTHRSPDHAGSPWCGHEPGPPRSRCCSQAHHCRFHLSW